MTYHISENREIIFPSGVVFKWFGSTFAFVPSPLGSEEDGFMVISDGLVEHLYGDLRKYRLVAFHPDRLERMFSNHLLSYVDASLGWLVEYGWENDVPW